MRYRTTSGPRWLMSRCPSSTGAQLGSCSCSVQNNARAHGYKALPEQTDQNHRSVATASPVVRLLHRKTPRTDFDVTPIRPTIAVLDHLSELGGS